MCQERAGKHCIQTGGDKVDVSGGESRTALYPDRWRQSGCVRRREQDSTVSRQVEAKWMCQEERAGKHCIQTGGGKVDVQEERSTVSRQVEAKWMCQEERAGKHCIQTGGGKVDVSGGESIHDAHY